MSTYTIAIIGTGVIGTSLGLALKQSDPPPYLLGHDKDLAQAKAALKKGAFDKVEWNLINACEEADLIFLAIPLNGIRPTLEAIVPYLKKGAVVSDTATSKIPPLAWAEELLPDHVHFVSGNPIVHPFGVGYEYATANLFRDKLYCLTPASSANEQAVQLLIGLVGILGAEPFFLDAVEHDGLITAVEHLPTLLSAALLNTLSAQPSWRETRKLAGRLFEQLSAGATGDPDGIKEGFVNSGDNLVRWLDSYISQLNQFRTLLTDKDSAEALAEMLDQAVVERHNWFKDYQKGGFIDPELSPPQVENPGLMKRLIGFGR